MRPLPWWLWPALLAIAVLLVGNEATWVLADAAPRQDEDTLRHVQRMVTQWQWLRHAPSWWVVMWPDYYPPLGGWTGAAGLSLLGPEVNNLRLSQAIFAGVVALGSGLLCGRIFGAWTGLAGAVLPLTLPLWWHQQSRTMLEIPAAAMLVLAVALAPDPRERRWARSAAGALAYGGSLLAHKTVALALLPMSLWLGGRAVVGLLRRGRAGAAHLAEVLLYGSGALLLLAWLPAAMPFIEETVGVVARQNTGDLPAGVVLGMAAWLKHAFYLPQHMWLLMLGLPCLLWRARSSPLVMPAVMAMLGLPLLLRFPQVHERYFLPLGVLSVVVMVAAPGLLESARHRGLHRLGALLSASIAAGALWFVLIWHYPERLPAQTMDIRHGSFSHLHPDTTVEAAMPWLLARPVRWAWALAPPGEGAWSYAALADALAERLPAPADPAALLAVLPSPGAGPVGKSLPADAPCVVVTGSPVDVRFLDAELVLRDRAAVRVGDRAAACGGEEIAVEVTEGRQGIVVWQKGRTALRAVIR